MIPVNIRFASILLVFFLCIGGGVFAETSIFDDPVPKYEGHGPTKTVPLWPIYYYKIYTSKGASRKHILWPLYTRTVTPQQKVNQFLSFQNKYPLAFSKHTYVLWPMVGFQSDPEFGYNDWIFPILWQSKVKGAGRQNVVFPLWWYYKQEEADGQHLNILILNHNYWGTGYHNHFLFPIVWTKWARNRGYNGYSHLLFPLFYFNRDEELAEGKFGTNMHTVHERAFITLLYRWYHDKIAPEGLAQVEDIGIFPLSFRKRENYLYYANGNIIRNDIFFLFPAFSSVRHHVVKPTKAPENFQELAEDPGVKILNRNFDLYLPLYFHMDGYEITDAPDLHDVKQIPTEYDFRWLLPYYSYFKREPVRSLSSQKVEIPDDIIQNIFMLSRNQNNLDTYTRRVRGVPLLYHQSRKLWTEGRTPKILVDQRSFYLFPFYTRYAKNKNAEGRESSFLLLTGWGNADLKIPEYVGYSQKYFYSFPFYLNSHRHSIGAVPYSLDDSEKNVFWLIPYYRLLTRRGKSIGRTDSVIPLFYHAKEEHTRRNWWIGIIAGKFERQIPLQSKFDSNKYPVTIYEDEDPNDFTRRISFLLPFWYAKYNLNSEYKMIFPFYGKSHSTPNDETVVKTKTFPLALGYFKTTSHADGSAQSKGFAAAGLYYKSSSVKPGADAPITSSYWHIFPFYAKTLKPNHKRTTSAIPPVSTDNTTIPLPNGNTIETNTMAVPHRWLPIYRQRHQSIRDVDNITNHVSSSSWLFPFYSFYANEQDGSSKTTVGCGLIYYNLISDSFQKQRVLSGAVSTKRTDYIGYGSKSAFFGLYGNTRTSWSRKKRFFPFYSKVETDDLYSEWNILGGLLGEQDSPTEHVSKYFYYSKHTTKESPANLLLDDDLHDIAKIQKLRHRELAQMYAALNQPEQSAIEFLLAEGEYDDDVNLILLAAKQFAILDPDKLERLLKAVPPRLLAATPAFSPDTFITYFPDEVYAKAVELYNKALYLGTDTSSTSLALALVYYKYKKYEQCFDILRQRYEKSQEKLDGLDLLHFYLNHAANNARFAHTKVHLKLTEELRERFPGDPIIEFLSAMQALSPVPKAYLDDVAIPLFKEVLELTDEYIIKSPGERHQILPLPSWPEPFQEVSPNGFPTYEQIIRATHNQLALCYLRKLQHLRTDVFGRIRNFSLYVPDTPEKKEQERREREMPMEEKQRLTTGYINNIMLHLSQGTDFEPFRKTFESESLYPCRSIQAQILLALKKDYLYDLKVNGFVPRKNQLLELNKILWKASFEISFLRNWKATLIQGGPSEKGNGPLDITANPDGFVDIDYAFGGIDNCTVEAVTNFHNYYPQKLTLHIGFDKTLAIEMNGQNVFGPVTRHIARRDQEAVQLDIPEGDISLKFIIKDDILNYGFFARFTNEQDIPFFFKDLHQIHCKLCGNQIENWIEAITPHLAVPSADEPTNP